MLTARGWWFLVTVVVLLLFGMLGHLFFFRVLRDLGIVTMLGLALLLWFLLEWLLFGIRSSRAVRHLSVAREVRDERGTVGALWAGRTFAVHLVVRWQKSASLPYVALDDAVHYGLELIGGATEFGGALERGDSAAIDYQVRCGGVGRVRFEGMRVRLADLQGFFYHVAFIRFPMEYR